MMDAPSDVAELVECYDSMLSTLLDKFAPRRQIRIKARPSATWSDADCRRCKATTRRPKIEKTYRKKPCDQSRRARHRPFGSQRELFSQKLVAYWTATIDAGGDKSNSKALWSKLRLFLQPLTDGDVQLQCIWQRRLAHHFATKTDRVNDLISAATSQRPHSQPNTL